MAPSRGRVKKLRIVFICLIGGFFLVCLAVISTAGHHRQVIDESAADFEFDDISFSNLPIPGSSENSKLFVKLPQQVTFDPMVAKTFMVSLDVVLGPPARGDNREKLIYKYNAKDRPYVGWAIAFRQYPSSFRPEVYWQDEHQKGSWLTFEELPKTFVVGSTISLMLIADINRTLSLFAQLHNPSDQTSEVFFLGGYDVSKIALPSTLEPLEIRMVNVPDSRQRSIVSSVLIVQSDMMFSSVDLWRAFISGGSKSLAARLKPEEIVVFLNDKDVENSQN